jgi:RPA family protein
MAEEQFKRHIAFKLRIGDILSGKPIMNGERFQSLELDGKKVVRVNVIGNVVEKFESPGESKYIFTKIDDGSGQISLKAFGDEMDKLKDLTEGKTILVIGVLRNFNNETYIAPEIVREQDPKYLLVRKLEIEKTKSNDPNFQKQQVVAVKDRILGAIKNSEQGVEVDDLINNLRDISPEIIRQETQKFLEEGIIFEPRPTMLKYLG